MPLIRKDPQTATSASQVRLNAVSADDRWAAARGFKRETASVAPLGAALAVEKDGRVREALLTALTQIHNEDAVAVILPLLRSDDAAVRTGALDALAAMPDAVEASIPKLLADLDPDVRLLVCDVVRHLPDPVASRHLCALLDRESMANVCAAAIEALSEVGNDEALPVLERCAQRFSQEPFLAFSIKIAVQRIGGDGRASDPKIV